MLLFLCCVVLFTTALFLLSDFARRHIVSKILSSRCPNVFETSGPPP
jgi:hypothetical protein